MNLLVLFPLWFHSSNFTIFWQVRLMKNRDTGETKGFAFVAFKTKEVAQQAIEELHNKDLKVCLDTDNSTTCFWQDWCLRNEFWGASGVVISMHW